MSREAVAEPMLCGGAARQRTQRACLLPARVRGES